MSDQTFEQMLDESFKTIHVGGVVEGTVIAVKPDEALLNIGYKSDALLTKNEYTSDPNVNLEQCLQIGDTLEVKILKANDSEREREHHVVVSYKRVAAERGNRKLEEAYNNHEIITAKVSRILNGGITANVDELQVFHTGKSCVGLLREKPRQIRGHGNRICHKGIQS